LSKRVMRLLAEKEIKRMLIQAAKNQGVSLQDIVEWLYYEAGIRARPSWSDVEKKVLSKDVDPQSLASFLLEQGVEIDEEEWLRILDKYSGLEEPRFLRRGERDK